eukprot:scaffold28996_cov101-Isochrysis_galbana.AAC.3
MASQCCWAGLRAARRRAAQWQGWQVLSAGGGVQGRTVSSVLGTSSTFSSDLATLMELEGLPTATLPVTPRCWPKMTAPAAGAAVSAISAAKRSLLMSRAPEYLQAGKRQFGSSDMLRALCARPHPTRAAPSSITAAEACLLTEEG